MAAGKCWLWRSNAAFPGKPDEERIASAGFAGQAECTADGRFSYFIWWACRDVFGQEVGEPGRGAEGFGGEDNRTTILITGNSGTSEVDE
ncbi:hypothetical protein CS542_01975 [Pedobacter sp. IW39]|nr:hypothetical protein CS542_01975 [Pedobacter sp. IW39]